MRVASPAASFFTAAGVGNLWIGKGSPLVLRLRRKGVSNCNVLGSSNVVGPNASCRTGPQIVVVGNQGTADTTPNF